VAYPQIEVGPVKIYGPSENLVIQAEININGNRFQYPYLNNVHWLRVGPGMATASYEIPRSELYEIVITMKTKNLRTNVQNEFGSQEHVTIGGNQVPYNGEYRLYEIQRGDVKAANVSASISYSLRNKR